MSDSNSPEGCLFGVVAIIGLALVAIYMFVSFVLPLVAISGGVAGGFVALKNFVISAFQVYRQRFQINKTSNYGC